MTREEWWCCGDPYKMVADAMKTDSWRTYEGRRKLERRVRLWAVACARLAWDHLDADTREAVELAERFADDRRLEKEARELSARITQKDIARMQTGGNGWAGCWATAWLLANDVVDRAWTSWRDTCPSLNREHHWRRWKTSHEEAVERAALLREVIGYPFGTWKKMEPPHDALMMAAAAYMGEWGVLGVLGDRLEDAGVGDEELWDHLRTGTHVKGCWALDVVLGRA